MGRFIDPSLVHHQLQYLGVLDSIRVRHTGFSFRTQFVDFYERFIIVVKQVCTKPVNVSDLL